MCWKPSCCHTAGKCLMWFQSHGVKLLQWPGNSPDLNPIENLSSRLKRRLVAQKHPSNKQDLIAAVISSWFHVIASDKLQNLVDSMPRRCQAVIDSKGYPTRYWTLSVMCHRRFSLTVWKSLSDLFLTENVYSISIIFICGYRNKITSMTVLTVTFVVFMVMSVLQNKWITKINVVCPQFFPLVINMHVWCY